MCVFSEFPAHRQNKTGNLILPSLLIVLIDAYTIHAASAVAANTFMRSILAAALPLVAQPLFNNLGIGIACTILGCIAAALGTVPFLFYVFGARLRAMSKMAADGDRDAKPPQGEKKMQKE